MDQQQASSLLASAVSVRVDIYKLVQPVDSDEASEIKPST
jgi:U3 small nucleolar RNA-associated protein 15